MNIIFLKLCVREPKTLLIILLEKLSPLISTKQYIELRWRLVIGGSLNLKNPQTYNEKLQWLKVYYHNPLYTTLVDKYKVKQYVAETIGSKYVIPLIASWNNVDEIEWEKLPSQFVIKCSHDCGGMVICRDKSSLNIDEAKRKLKDCFKTNYYYKSREWPYKDVPTKLFAEAYMEDEYGELRDYKFFCFNGEVKAMFIASDRSKKTGTCFDFYDADFNHLPFTQGHPNASTTIKKPQAFDEMKELASKLSQGMPHVRVDFYEVNGQIYFGEFTFFHYGGMMLFDPEEWDYTFGSWITLPINNKQDGQY